MSSNIPPYNQPSMPPQMGRQQQMQMGRPQMPQGAPLLPPPPSRRQGNNTWRQRMLGGNNGRPLTLREERTLPNWIVGSSVAVFFIAFAACTFAYGYPMEVQLALIASISVLLFFYGSKSLSQSWMDISERRFIRNVFIIGFVIRLAWVLYCYFFFNPEHYGATYGDGADVVWYMPFGKAIAEWVTGIPVSDMTIQRVYMPTADMSFPELMKQWGSAMDDVGYPIWLSVICMIFGYENDVFIPFVIKCIIGAYCGVCIFHVAKRHFDEGTAHLAALFVALNPNMIYWCGTMFKEVEMVFLCCLCIDLVDSVFSSNQKLTFKGLLPAVLIGSYLFFFRAALAIVIFMAMFAHIVMASDKVMSTGKKIIAGVMVGVVLLVGLGDRLRTQTEKIVNTVQSDQQKINMEWRANRTHGNSFAKYASAAVFAPLIFTIPFPTFNMAHNGQVLQSQLSGGSYIKNILSFFVIWVMFIMLLSGEWRRHVFILVYTGGYLTALVFSNFAHSGRFHMPIWPMLMLFAAYGIQMAKTNPKMRRWFPLALVLEVVICLAWNWFKLAGRGMI